MVPTASYCKGECKAAVDCVVYKNKLANNKDNDEPPVNEFARLRKDDKEFGACTRKFMREHPPHGQGQPRNIFDWGTYFAETKRVHRKTPQYLRLGHTLRRDQARPNAHKASDLQYVGETELVDPWMGQGLTQLEANKEVGRC